MKRTHHFARSLGLPALLCLFWAWCSDFPRFSTHAASLPKVTLNAESIRPRPIEQRTGEAVTRDYAHAWQDLADALDTNRVELLNNYFTGEARERLRGRISDQQKAGLRTRHEDHGHQVKAVFYSLDGGEMQLVDEAQIELTVFDGQKTIYRAQSTYKYVVLMTPGQTSGTYGPSKASPRISPEVRAPQPQRLQDHRAHSDL